MWDKDDPKSKWFHLVVKLIAMLIIFKLGVMVGEFKIIKAMVLRGGAGQGKMLIKGDGDGFFEKRLMPGQGGNMMFWKGDGPGPDLEKAPLP